MGNLAAQNGGLPHADIHSLADAFSAATGVGAHVVEEGDPSTDLYAAHGKLCGYCKTVMSCINGLSRCRESILDGGRQALRLGEPYIMRCHAGVVSVCAPVVSQGEFVGAMECGPMLLWDWDEMAISEFLEHTESLGLPPQTLVAESRSILGVTSQRVGALAKLLRRLYAPNEEMAGSSDYRKALSEQQAVLWSLVTEQKRLGVPGAYPLEMERELMGRVRLGDRAGAKRVLNQLLGRIFYVTGDVSIIKARVLELVVMLSRSAVESGASLQKLLGLNYNFISELSDIELFEDVCVWVVKVLDIFLDAVTETRTGHTVLLIEKALDYIRDNFRSNLTLDAVAARIHISPYYLSHLIKEEYGFTFVDYLTRVRVEEARRLLLQTNLPVSDIASAVGYEDSGYFIKVFKKNTSVTPGRYRRMGGTAATTSS